MYVYVFLMETPAYNKYLMKLINDMIIQLNVVKSINSKNISTEIKM